MADGIDILQLVFSLTVYVILVMTYSINRECNELTSPPSCDANMRPLDKYFISATSFSLGKYPQLDQVCQQYEHLVLTAALCNPNSQSLSCESLAGCIPAFCSSTELLGRPEAHFQVPPLADHGRV